MSSHIMTFISHSMSYYQVYVVVILCTPCVETWKQNKKIYRLDKYTLENVDMYQRYRASVVPRLVTCRGNGLEERLHVGARTARPRGNT